MRGYGRRRVGGRMPHRLFIIVCEGTETEPTYFRRYRERGREPLIETPKTSRTDPVGLVRYARKMVREHDVDVRRGDRVWCVFDADQNDDGTIRRASELARPDINIALSNPSFELWFLLHFAYDESKTDNATVVGKLKSHIPRFTKTTDAFDILLPKRGDAIRHAKRLNELHCRRGTDLLSGESNPSTQVFVLVEEILGLESRSGRGEGA